MLWIIWTLLSLRGCLAQNMVYHARCSLQPWKEWELSCHCTVCVLKFPTLIADLSTFPCSFISFCFMYLDFCPWAQRSSAVSVQCACAWVDHWMDDGGLNALGCRSCSHTLCEAAVFTLMPEPGVHRTGRWEDACKAREQRGTLKKRGLERTRADGNPHRFSPSLALMVWIP